VVVPDVLVEGVGVGIVWVVVGSAYQRRFCPVADNDIGVSS
jgi:hypothetical protein